MRGRRPVLLVLGAVLVVGVAVVVIRLRSSPDPVELRAENARLVDTSIRQAGLDPASLKGESGSVPRGVDVFGAQRYSATFRRVFGGPPDGRAWRMLHQVREYWASVPDQVSITRDGSSDRTPVVLAKSGGYSMEAIVGAVDGFEVSVTSPCARYS